MRVDCSREGVGRLSDSTEERPARREAEEPENSFRMRVLLWFSWWVVFFVVYMLLAGVLVTAELILGAAAAALAASVAELVRVQDARQFRPRLRWVLRVYRLPPAILADCVVVFRALWRHVVRNEEVRGDFRAFRFPVAGSGGRAAGRRVLLNAAISITPNTYVVGIDEDNETVLVHQLVPCERSRAREEIVGRL
jgi:multisubunit Na+/H+ antiporter MnhE subunit